MIVTIALLKPSSYKNMIVQERTTLNAKLIACTCVGDNYAQIKTKDANNISVDNLW